MHSNFGRISPKAQPGSILTLLFFSAYSETNSAVRESSAFST